MLEPPFQFCVDDAVEETEPHEDEPNQETFICSWDELVFEMTNGEHGTKPRETPQRYAPQENR